MTVADDSMYYIFFWPIMALNVGYLVVRLMFMDDITREFYDGEYLGLLKSAGCKDENGNPVKCTTAELQERWGTICIDGYTYDAMPCTDGELSLL